MEALLQDPETTGVSVEILPDLFVPADVAWRVQVLVMGLIASLALLALDRGVVDARALVRAAAAPRAAPSAEPAPPTADPRYREQFRAARARGLELLRFAVATLPADAKVTTLELASDEADGLTVRAVCDGGMAAVEAYLESLRVMLPTAALGAGDEGQLVIVGRAR